MGTKVQAFLAFFAETITQILLSAVALTVLFSDQLVITTKPAHGMPAFSGKCSITAYTTDQVAPFHCNARGQVQYRPTSFSHGLL